MESQPDPGLSEGMVTLKEAMRLTSLSRAKLYRLMDAGDLAFVKVGAARRIPRRSIINLMSRGLNHPQAMGG